MECYIFGYGSKRIRKVKMHSCLLGLNKDTIQYLKEAFRKIKEDLLKGLLGQDNGEWFQSDKN